ncbi:MAG: hypothetical protein D6682_05215 [Zetaproteobacteria bacterium]|nr:MAG: hypothetical protein D6682_05215 [Zetaproteobacteria bacterium]
MADDTRQVGLSTSHVAAFGGACGALIGFAICMVVGIGFYETVVRMAVLGIAGAWIGMMLKWLNDLLPRMPEPEEDAAEEPQGEEE